MAKNTTPAAPTTTGKQVKQHPTPDVRAPLVTDMQSARDYGYCSPYKGKAAGGKGGKP